MEQPSAVVPLEIVVGIYGSTITVTVAGELDFAVAEQLAAVMHPVLADAPEMVVLDLSAVTFIDVAGARAVQGACEHARARSARVTILPGGPGVQRVFKLTGLESRLPFAVAAQVTWRRSSMSTERTRAPRARREVCRPRSPQPSR
jgi:anti-sigma B factor antagonist